MKKQKWEGQIEKVQMEYTISAGEHDPVATGPMNIMVGNSEIPIDKTDCLIAASSGILTAMLDVLWVGEFSLRYAPPCMSSRSCPCSTGWKTAAAPASGSGSGPP